MANRPLPLPCPGLLPELTYKGRPFFAVERGIVHGDSCLSISKFGSLKDFIAILHGDKVKNLFVIQLHTFEIIWRNSTDIGSQILHLNGKMLALVTLHRRYIADWQLHNFWFWFYLLPLFLKNILVQCSKIRKKCNFRKSYRLPLRLSTYARDVSNIMYIVDKTSCKPK